MKKKKIITCTRVALPGSNIGYFFIASFEKKNQSINGLSQLLTFRCCFIRREFFQDWKKIFDSGGGEISREGKSHIPDEMMILQVFSYSINVRKRHLSSQWRQNVYSSRGRQFKSNAFWYIYKLSLVLIFQLFFLKLKISC